MYAAAKGRLARDKPLGCGLRLESTEASRLSTVHIVLGNPVDNAQELTPTTNTINLRAALSLRHGLRQNVIPWLLIRFNVCREFSCRWEASNKLASSVMHRCACTFMSMLSSNVSACTVLPHHLHITALCVSGYCLF
jgi:hypothetical protein